MNCPVYDSVDLLIVGAGIAGLSVAAAACEYGLTTVVVDRDVAGAGASGAPQALLNPATGRRAKKVWRAETCLIRTQDLMESVARETGEQFFVNRGVLRPPLDEKMSQKMRDEIASTRWPSGWVEWLEPWQTRDRFPSIPAIGGALWIPVGCAVAMHRFIRALVVYLKRRGVQFHEQTALEREQLPKNAVTKDGTLLCEPGAVVMAAGTGICEDPDWSSLPLHKVKGQTLEVELNAQLPFECSISSLGYLAQGADLTGRIVLGSTYEHQFDHRLPDHDGEEYLLNRLGRTITDLRSRIVNSGGWANVRVTTPDKKPFAGAHPTIDHLYGIGGLGSKGLMMGPTLGAQLIQHILQGEEIPEPFRIERMIG